jgi:hypothetical protein
MKKGVSLAKGEIAKEDHFDSNISLVETWYAARAACAAASNP